MSTAATGVGPRRATTTFIFVTVLLDMLALGVIIPVLPKLVLGFLRQDEVEAAKLIGLFGTVWAVMQLFFSPLFGSLSDRFGRRKIILLSNFGLSADYVIMALAPTWQWLLAGRVISGITASSVPTAYAYIADVTPPEKRAGAFGLIGAAFGLGFVMGPALGGFLGKENPRLPFWIAAGLSLLNALYGLFVLPESLPLEGRQAFSWRRANPLAPLSLLVGRARMRGLSAVAFLGYVAHVVLPTMFVLYAQYRYGWDERGVGLALAAVGVGSVVVQAGLVGPLSRRLGARRTLLLGLLAGVIGFALTGLARTSALLSVAIAVNALWGLAGPSLMALLSERVSPSEQGQLQGANNSMRALSEVLGPGLFSLVYAHFIQAGRPVKIPGAPFFVAAVLLGLSLLLAIKVARPVRGEVKSG